MEKAAAIASIW